MQSFWEIFHFISSIHLGLCLPKKNYVGMPFTRARAMGQSLCKHLNHTIPYPMDAHWGEIKTKGVIHCQQRESCCTGLFLKHTET
jgi:hypothetical protein